jgi:hypothetical protein
MTAVAAIARTVMRIRRLMSGEENMTFLLAITGWLVSGLKIAACQGFVQTSTYSNLIKDLEILFSRHTNGSHVVFDDVHVYLIIFRNYNRTLGAGKS